MLQKAFSFIILPLLLLSCGSGKGRIRIDAHLQNINQADLLIYSPDGAFQDIDTLHLMKGKAEKDIALQGGPYTFIILYPNMATLQFMASEGQKVKIRGDVQMIGQEEITGCDSIIRSDSIPQQPPISIGQPMPEDSVLQAAKEKDKPMLLAFWANWRGGSTSANNNLRQAMLQQRDSLTAISYSLDIEPQVYKATYHAPNTTYVRYCNFRGLQDPLFRKLKLNNIPYYILFDAQGNIAAHGANYQLDIVPNLKRTQPLKLKDVK